MDELIAGCGGVSVTRTARLEDEDPFLREKFTQAFGALLINSEGGTDSEIRKMWWRAVALRGKQYSLPDGAIGTRFVHMLSAELEACTAGRQSSEAEFVFTSLILQRDKMVRCGRDVRRLLARRMDTWDSGRLQELLHEAERCDKQLTTTHLPMTTEHVERIFNRLMLQGKVRSAVRFLTERSGGGVLDLHAEAHGKSGPLGRSVLDVLEEKHPSQREVVRTAFVECDELPPLEHVDITAAHIETVARRLHGGAGPSGTDSSQWRSFLLRYGKASARLREAVASSTRYHANEVVPWDRIRAFLARRGLALDKLPGVRPIGIGECRQRLEAKAMALATGIDIQELCGADQLCAGAKAGIEAAIHAMKSLFDAEDSEGLLLVDAANAFNTLCRPAALWNCRVLWPRCSMFLFNSYRGYAVVVFRSGSLSNGKGKDTLVILHSHEGTTQGCPLAMLEYAAGIYPLIMRLKDPSRWKQNWYADDSSCAGKLGQIKHWFTLLMEIGPEYGYYAEPTKSSIIVKEQFVDSAKAMFAELKVEVTVAGRFLGGCLGKGDAVREYVRERIHGWKLSVERLAQAARCYPQSAHAAFTHSLSCEWQFLQRVIGGFEDEYCPLGEAIRSLLTPTLLGREVLHHEHALLELPARCGGLALTNPVSSAAANYASSKCATAVLQEAVCSGLPADMTSHSLHCKLILDETAHQRRKDQTAAFEDVCATLPALPQRRLRRIVKNEASTWLTVLPLQQDGYDLSATQFRDQLAIRYGHEPIGLPPECDGCGAPFSLQHSLDCKKGGLVKRGHDDLRDSDAQLADLAWGGVCAEPVLVPDNDKRGRPSLRADWMARGVWEGSRVAFFDNRIIDADAPSYLTAHLSWESLANRAATEKKNKYSAAAEELRGSFTPLVCSTDGALHREYNSYLKRVANRLATKWKKPYSQLMGWVKTRTQFALIRAVDLRLRGTRRKILSLGLQDGAAVGLGHC